MLELPVTNRYPDCVALKFHLEPDEGFGKRSPLAFFARTEVATCPDVVRLSISISFSGEQEIEVPGGKRLGLPGGLVSFGVKRGLLRLRLGNCSMPMEEVSLSNPFLISKDVETQTSRSHEVQASTTLESRSIGAKATSGTTEKTTQAIFHVEKTGSENKPAWVFRSESLCLKGSLLSELLGVLSVVASPYEISADFTVRGEDVLITWGKIGHVPNIHRNKFAVIERAIALRYIQPLIEAFPLSEGRGEYG